MAASSVVSALRESFYGIFYQHISDGVIEKAVEEISSSSAALLVKRNCPRSYARYRLLSLCSFLSALGITADNGSSLEAGEFHEGVPQVLQRHKVHDTDTVFEPSKDVTAEAKRGNVLATLREELLSIEHKCSRKSVTASSFGAFRTGRKQARSKGQSRCG